MPKAEQMGPWTGAGATLPDPGSVPDAPGTLPQQVEALYECGLASQVLALLASIFFVLLIRDAAPGGFPAGWLIAFVCVTAARIVLVLAYRTRRARLSTRAWRNAFAVGACAAGAAWGFAGAALIGAPDLLSQNTAVFVIAGLIAAGISYLAPVPLAVHAFVVPALLPVALQAFGRGGTVYEILGTMIVFFGVAMIVASHYINRQMVRGFKQRSENAGLIKYLSRVNRIMTDANGELSAEIKQHKEIERNLQYAATHDELTDLRNRRQFLSSLRAALQKAERHDRKLGVFLIDIDRFKNINDTLGHNEGDRVLVEIAARIAASVRESDIVGRFGGDEFAVLLDEVKNLDDCARVAHKVLDVISGTPYGLDGRNLHVTASIGVSTYPGDGKDLDTLIKNAEIAMYRAKEKRESSFEYYSVDANRHSIERLSLESDLRSALDTRELMLAYQPKFRIADGGLVGFEALLRWQHPLHGLVPPTKFIPLAEESGLIVPIGELVLNNACEQAARWRADGVLGENAGMAVNISPRQFGHAGLLDQIVSALDNSGLPGRMLEVEITEGAVMHDLDHAMRILAELRARQIQVSIDDFGTGHSSLSYLKRFPISRIKIDKSFVDELPGNADDAAITRTIITMAHNLRLKAIVEGVERAEQLDFMRAHGCDEVQGYHTGRPMFAAEFAPEASAALDARAIHMPSTRTFH